MFRPSFFFTSGHPCAMERAAPIEETKSHSETESSVEKAGDPNSQPSTSQTPKEGEVQVAGVARIEALYKVLAAMARLYGCSI